MHAILSNILVPRLNIINVVLVLLIESQLDNSEAITIAATPNLSFREILL